MSGMFWILSKQLGSRDKEEGGSARLPRRA